MKARSAIGALLLTSLALTSVHASELTPAEARAIAKEAYVYGFPMVHSYRIQHAYFVDVRSPEYKAPWNRLRNIARVYTPDDKAVQTPNSDTPYSLPAPKGPFLLVLRLYWPKEEALDGRWTAPALQRVE